MEKREVTTVPGEEQDQVARSLLEWLNEYDDFPPRITEIESEFLDEKNSMALFVVTAPYKTLEYISGAYNAQYQFSLNYRTATHDSEDRLNAVDALTKIASWAEKRKDLPELGPGKNSISIERNSPAGMIARYEDGTEDYQILMTFYYEVRP